jgi:hypothetical protein
MGSRTLTLECRCPAGLPPLMSTLASSSGRAGGASGEATFFPLPFTSCSYVMKTKLLGRAKGEATPGVRGTGPLTSSLLRMRFFRPGSSSASLAGLALVLLMY